ncbi:MAG: class I SAM-dependent methyltransferase [Actinomycetota bacterium]
MSKKSDRSAAGSPQSGGAGSWFATSNSPSQWQTLLSQVAARFNREYRQEALNFPEEVEAMPIFRELVAGTLTAKTASPFWQVAKPLKNQRCLDIGCGVSFLIYPWREWDAYFYGQEISEVAQEGLNARGPQLNSKLFKGVELAPAHQLRYEAAQFDLAIATGFSCYFPLEYWTEVMGEVKRVLKPGGDFVFDLLNPEAPLAEDWAILETYRGAEVFLEAVADWEKLIKAIGAKVVKRQSGELFDLYKVRF